VRQQTEKLRKEKEALAAKMTPLIQDHNRIKGEVDFQQ